MKKIIKFSVEVPVPAIRKEVERGACRRSDWNDRSEERRVGKEC